MTRSRALAAVALLVPSGAHASFLSGDTLDAFANGLSWFVVFVIPLVVIGVFWYIHILPELIAEKRQHPHKDSIKVLCILSLFFGGLLWPFAWLWAYTRPIGYRAIYGTEKHHDYYVEMGEKLRAGHLSAAEIEHLDAEMSGMVQKGVLPADLRALAAEVKARAATLPPPAAPVISRERAPEPVETQGGND
jgi:CBS domain containing-hemolysin-like protein